MDELYSLRAAAEAAVIATGKQIDMNCPDVSYIREVLSELTKDVENMNRGTISIKGRVLLDQDLFDSIIATINALAQAQSDYDVMALVPEAKKSNDRWNAMMIAQNKSEY